MTSKRESTRSLFAKLLHQEYLYTTLTVIKNLPIRRFLYFFILYDSICLKSNSVFAQYTIE